MYKVQLCTVLRNYFTLLCLVLSNLLLFLGALCLLALAALCILAHAEMTLEKNCSLGGVAKLLS